MMSSNVAMVLLVTLLLFTPMVHADPIGTAFSYQGRLEQAGQPVNGTVDLTLRLFDEITGGRQVGPTLELQNVVVTDGLFEIALDFGAFGDLAVWLEIEIEKTILSPRQPIKPAPVALHALSIGNLQPDSLSGQYPNPVQLTNPSNQVSGSFTGSGANLADLNASNILTGTLADTRLSGNIARRNLSNTFAQSNFFMGNVGIGTATPGTPLDVAGPIRSSGTTGGVIQVPNPNNQNASVTLSWLNDVARIRVGGSGVGANGGFDIQRIGDQSMLRVDGEGNIGIGTSNPMRDLHLRDSNASMLLEGTGGSSSYLRFIRGGVDADDAQNYIALSSANGSLVTRVAGLDRMRIMQNGNVGINNNNPAEQLHVSGSVRVDTGPPGLTYSTLEGDRLSSSGTFTLLGGEDLVVDSNRHTIIQSFDDLFLEAGRNAEFTMALDGLIEAAADLDVSAGTTLDLRGNNELRLSSAGPLLINTSGLTANGSRVGINNASPAATLQVDGATSVDALRVRINGTTRLLVSDTGGISGGVVVGGNTDPQYQLHVAGAGSAGKPGGGLWAATSDRRLKKNVEALEGALERVLALNGVTFEYIDPQSINEEPGTHMGLIAQEVEEIFPSWVHEAPDGYKRVSETGTTALFVEALRDLRAEKDAEIARLTDQNEELIERLERLERALSPRAVLLP